MNTAPRISFCTTCFNRYWQLKQTIDINAGIVAESRNIEWVILDYASDDELHEFMMSRLGSLPSRVVYARIRERRSWHMSIAKNLAHRLGRGEVLMNIDCDNVFADAVAAITRAFSRGVRTLHHWSGVFGDGTCGRIAIAREAFYALGGYDESFHPMGFEDLDLLRRVQASGIGAPLGRRRSSPGLAITNTNEESIRYCSDRAHTRRDFDAMNRLKSAANIAAGRFIANETSGWTPLDADIWTGHRLD